MPTTTGHTPKLGGWKVGAHSAPEKKSERATERKNSTVGSARATMMPTVVSTDTRAHAPRRTLMSPSP